MRDSRRRRWVGLAFGLLLALAPLTAGSVLAATTAADDHYPADEDEALAVVAPGVLGNDTTDGGTLCVTSFDASSLKGSLGDGVAEDGSFTFTPNPDYNGLTGFNYDVALVVDGACSDTIEGSAFVTIAINGANDAPTAVADRFTALAGRTLNVGPPGLLGNDSDVDGDSLTAVKVDNPMNGVVTVGPDGGFSYTPANGFVGTDSFSYRASDGTALSETRAVTLTVGAIPTPVPTAPPPTPAPTAEITEEPSASPSLEPSASAEASASPSAAPPSSSPAASPVPGDPTSSAGGLSIPVMVVGLLLLSLVAFGAAVLVPKWLQRQRAGEVIEDEAGYLDDEYPGERS